jgi:hypothetical protein
LKLPKACIVLVGLFLLGSWSATVPSILEHDSSVLRSGTPDRVVIDNPPVAISADEVVSFEALKHKN